jgi:hypothetical protein
MFFIDFRDFLNNPLYFGFNFAEHETLFLRIFEFQGASGCQMNSIFLPRHFFKETKLLRIRSQ